jgi:glycosyltransferase involved in cell wall biosynthesis
LLLAFFYRLFHRNVKIILHIAHDANVQKYKLMLENARLAKSIDNFFRWIGMHLIKHVIAQTFFQQKMLLNNYRLPSRVIHNFCEPAEPTNLDDKENIVIWVANIKPMKNPLEFIRLANELRESGYRFLMIGKRPGKKFEASFYRSLNSSNVEYLGQLTNEEVNSALSRAKIFCCTSFREGFSNTFLQAWIRNVPVVSLHVDPDQLINQHKLGFHSGTIEKLKRDVQYLIDNPVEWSSMARRVRHFAEENFLISNTFHEFENFIKEIYQQS